METTGNITFALPLILTLIAAKWTGDFFNEVMYKNISLNSYFLIQNIFLGNI